jgi:hypothetical protein
MKISYDPCPESNWTQANEDQVVGVYRHRLNAVTGASCFLPYCLPGFLGSWLSFPQGIQKALYGFHYGNGRLEGLE